MVSRSEFDPFCPITFSCKIKSFYPDSKLAGGQYRQYRKYPARLAEVAGVLAL